MNVILLGYSTEVFRVASWLKLNSVITLHMQTKQF